MRVSLRKSENNSRKWYVIVMNCDSSKHRADFVGEKTKIYTCCSRSTEIEGCDRGPHVFYESDPEDLHRRHGFSFTRPPISAEYPGPNGNTEDTAYDIVALDCEMVYSTGGMRVARVSIVDGSGKEIFDEIIRMDDGVEVMYVQFSLLFCLNNLVF